MKAADLEMREMIKAFTGMVALFLLTASPTVLGQKSPKNVPSILEVLEVLEEARRAALAVEEDISIQSLLTMIAMTQAGAGDSVGAIETADASKSEGEKNLILLSIAGEEARRGKVEQSFSTIEKITQDTQRISALGMAAGERARAGDIFGAFEFADEIPPEQYKERTEALRHIAFQQAEEGYALGASQTFAEALDAALEAPEPKERIDLIVSIAETQATLGNKSGAEATLQNAFDILPTISPQHRPQLLGRIAGPLAMITEERSSVREMLGELRQRNHLTNPEDQTSQPEEFGNQSQNMAFFSLAIRKLHLGKIEEAWEMAQKIEDESTKGRVLMILSTRQASKGDEASALRTANQIGHDASKAEALSWIAALQAYRQADPSRAAITMDRAIRIAKSIREENERDQTLAR